MNFVFQFSLARSVWCPTPCDSSKFPFNSLLRDQDRPSLGLNPLGCLTFNSLLRDQRLSEKELVAEWRTFNSLLRDQKVSKLETILRQKYFQFSLARSVHPQHNADAFLCCFQFSLARSVPRPPSRQNQRNSGTFNSLLRDQTLTYLLKLLKLRLSILSCEIRSRRL